MLTSIVFLTVNLERIQPATSTGLSTEGRSLLPLRLVIGKVSDDVCNEGRSNFHLVGAVFSLLIPSRGGIALVISFRL